ncbi:hypothetical protein FKP32DRAFT_1454649 [Trametes sanguinea]|nr:hypothetical protein FKP32DRAFT_1454649 [Trametes sanguinea]
MSGQPRTTIRSVQNISAARGKSLLSQWWTFPDLDKNDFFQQHVSDLGSILAYLWGRDPSQEQTDLHSEYTLAVDFLCFITRRARSKIVARINNAANLWGGESPIDILHKASGDSESDVLTCDIVKFKDRVPTSLAEALKKQKLFPNSDNPKHYAISDSNIGNWMNLFNSILKSIKDAFKDTIKTVPPSRDETIEAVSNIQDLGHLLRSNLRSVLNHDGYGHIVRKLQGRRVPREDTGHRNKKDGEGQEVDDDDLLEHLEEVDLTEVEHVFHYYETVTAWDTAIRSVFRHEGVLQQLKIFTVTNLPKFNVNLDRLEQAMTTYSSLLHSRSPSVTAETDASDLVTIINQRLDTIRENTFMVEDSKESKLTPQMALKKFRMNAKVHAETSLMGLAWMHRQGMLSEINSDADLNAVFPDGAIPLGVSKKCCWCCNFLGKSLDQPPSLEFPRVRCRT